MTAQRDPATSPIVKTTTGTLRGRRNVDSGLSEFFGIPYAEPPVGPLRFRAPVPKTPWEGTQDALRFGSAAVQIFDPHEARAEDIADDPTDAERGWIGSEDCLTLNIWTPATDGAKRPVMIWIHGGANHLESGRMQLYHGDRLAAKGDIVFVTLNYRLGIFGFLDVTALGQDARYSTSGLNGILDQALAVDWIHANIAAFGGDPDNITLAGESAGGINVSWLVASGRLKGKVRRVMPMSNLKGAGGFGETPGGSRHDPAVGKEIALGFIDRLGFTTLADLCAAPAAEIMERLLPTIRMEETLFDLDTLFYPCLNAEHLPMEPFRALRAGALDGMEMMLGYTNYEAGLWLTWTDDLDQHPPEWAAELLPNLLPEPRAMIASLYRRWFPEEAEGKLGVHMLSDYIFAMPITWFAEEAAQAGSKVWLYRHDWKVNERFGAMHAAELPFFFNRPNEAVSIDLIGAPADAEDARQRQLLADAMSGALLAFVRHGRPRLPDGTPWPAFDQKTRSTMLFDRPHATRVVQDPSAERRIWWTEAVYAPVMPNPVPA